MKIKAAVSEWNHSIFRPPNRELNHAIANAVTTHSAKRVKIPKLIGLMRARTELDKKMLARKKGSATHHDLYDIFNKRMLKGIPVSVIKGAVDSYMARKARFVEWNYDDHMDENGQYIPKPIEFVDKRILDSLWTLTAGGVITTVFSHSYDYGIQRALEEQRATLSVKEIIANTLLEYEGAAVGFTTHIRERSFETFKSEFLEKRGIAPEELLYIGCSKHVKGLITHKVLPACNIIVPFFASDEFKAELAALGAFVPTYAWAIQHYVYYPKLLKEHLENDSKTKKKFQNRFGTSGSSKTIS